MAQTVNKMVRYSCAVPISIGIMVVGLFLFCTRRISEVGLILFLILGCAVWIIGEILPTYNELRIAQLNDNTNRQNLLAEQEKTKHLRLYVIIKSLVLVTPIVGYVIYLLRKIHWGH